MIRVSAVPPHISTAVFSTCDVKFWQYLISTLFSLPKQIFLVYLGTVLVRDKKSQDKDEKKQNTIQTIVMVVILLITIVMAWFLWKKMKAIKVVLLEEQEQRRRAKQSMMDGRDEEEGAAGEWNSAVGDVRNEDFSPLVQGHGSVSLPYNPIPTGANVAYRDNGRMEGSGPVDYTHNANTYESNTYDANANANANAYNSRLY
jgi:hypothetical protein